jgi:hypothetical protein
LGEEADGPSSTHREVNGFRPGVSPFLWLEVLRTSCGARQVKPRDNPRWVQGPYLSRWCAFANHSSIAGKWEVRGTCAQQLRGLRGVGDSGHLFSQNPPCSLRGVRQGRSAPTRTFCPLTLNTRQQMVSGSKELRLGVCHGNALRVPGCCGKITNRRWGRSKLHYRREKLYFQVAGFYSTNQNNVKMTSNHILRTSKPHLRSILGILQASQPSHDQRIAHVLFLFLYMYMLPCAH